MSIHRVGIFEFFTLFSFFCFFLLLVGCFFFLFFLSDQLQKNQLPIVTQTCFGQLNDTGISARTFQILRGNITEQLADDRTFADILAVFLGINRPIAQRGNGLTSGMQSSLVWPW